MMPLEFIGWNIEEKRRHLRGIQDAILTGDMVEIQTASGKTVYDPKSRNLNSLLEKLATAIAADPEYDADNAIDAACAAAGRPGITQVNFC